MTKNANAYGVMPMALLEDETVTASAKLLFVRIEQLTYERGYCYASNIALAKLMKTTDRNISRLLASLDKYVVAKHPNNQYRQIRLRKNVVPEIVSIDKNDEAATTRMSRRSTNTEGGTTKMSKPVRQIRLPNKNINNNHSNKPITKKVSTPKVNEVITLPNGNGASAPVVARIKPFGVSQAALVTGAFEQAMGLKMNRLKSQQQAAQTCIDRYGVDRVFKAINAVVLCRDMEYAPRILDMVNLRDKWNHLEAFYRRKATKQIQQEDIV